MIIYFYLLIPLVFQSSDSSSIRGRNYKNDLVPFTSSRLESSKKDNSLKILSHEPFIIQMQMPKGHESKMFKETVKKKKWPMKKRVSKMKPLRKKLRRRRDLQKLKSLAVREKKPIQLEIPQTANATKLEMKNFKKSTATREELLKALSSHQKTTESSKIEDFKDDDKNSTPRTSSLSRNLQNHISLLKQSPTFKMVYPSTPKPDRHHHKYTYRDLVADRKRLEQKINYIKNMLDVNDTSTDDIVRIRRRSESDRTANKIAKMFLTLSAVNGLHDKRKSKCKNDDDEEDRVQDIWEKERKNSLSRKNTSSNEERYKVKKWIEFMKNKRLAGKTCTCLENPYGEEGDIFPLEQKLPRDYFLTKKSKSSEESSEAPENLFYSSDKFNKNNFMPSYREDPENQLKRLIKKNNKSDLPLSELELYRSRAKEILRNAEEILDRIKEEEEKRLATPNFLMNHLKELTSRIQGDPRNNENDLIKKIQKSLGCNPLAKSQDGLGGNCGNTFVDNMKSYILDPYEKAKALTDESTKKLSTYLLQNLGKFQESSEEEQPRESDDQRDNLQVFLGELPRKEEEKPQPDNLAKEQPHLFSTYKELPKGGNTLFPLGFPKEPIKNAIGNKQDISKQKIENIMKEQQKKLNDYVLTHDPEESSKEMEPVGEVKGLEEVKFDLPIAEDKVAVPKDEVSGINQQPKGGIKTINSSKIYNSGFAEQKPTPEKSFQEEKDQKSSKILQKEEKALDMLEEITEATEKKEQANDNQDNSVAVEKEQNAKSEQTSEGSADPTLLLEQIKEKQEPEEVEELLKAEKTESLEGKENEMEERNEEPQSKEEEKQKLGEGTLGKENLAQKKHRMSDSSEKADREETDILTAPHFIPEDYNDFLELENDEIPEEKETFKEDLQDKLNEFSPNEESFLRMEEEPETESDEEARAESDLLSELLDPTRSSEVAENLKESSRADGQGKEEYPSVTQTEERGKQPLSNRNLVQEVVSESKEANEPAAGEDKNEDSVLESSKLNEEGEEKRKSEEQIMEADHLNVQNADDPIGKESTDETLKATMDEQADPASLEAKMGDTSTASNEQENAKYTPLDLEEPKDSSKEKPEENINEALNERNLSLEAKTEDTLLQALDPENQKKIVETTNDKTPSRETSDNSQGTSVEENTTQRAENLAEGRSTGENRNDETVIKELDSNERVAISSPKGQEMHEAALKETSLEENEEKAVNSNDGIDEPTLKEILSKKDEDSSKENTEESILKVADPIKKKEISVEVSDKELPNDQTQEILYEDQEKPVLKLEKSDEESLKTKENEEGETLSENVPSKHDQGEIFLKEANQETGDAEDETVKAAAADDENQETRDAEDETVKAAAADDENQVADDAEDETVKAAADENQETGDTEEETVKAAAEDDAEDETVKAAADDENQETGDAEEETVKAAADDENQESGDAEEETVKAAAADDENQETGDAEEETVKAAAADDENEETGDTEEETVKAAADDENQETGDAEDETVKAAVDDENQETGDAEDETVKAAAADDENQVADDAEDETVKAAADDENQETGDAEDETVKAAADDENQETGDAEEETVKAAAADDENQETGDAEEETVKAAAADDENQETGDAEEETVKAAADDENQETGDAEEETVKAAVDDENQETGDAEEETVKAAADDENQETGDAEEETVKAAADDENQVADDAEDETVKAAADDENQVADDAEDETVKAAVDDENQKTGDAEDETVKVDLEESGGQRDKNEEKTLLRATLDDGENKEMNEDGSSLKDVSSNEKVELEGVGSEAKQNVNNENVKPSLNDPKNIEDIHSETVRSEDAYQDTEMDDINLLKSAKKTPENEFGNTINDENSMKSANAMDEADAEISKEGSEETLRAENDLDNHIDEGYTHGIGKSANSDGTVNPDKSLEKVKAETPLGENLITEDRLRKDSDKKINQDSSLSDLLRMSDPEKKIKVPKSIGEIMKDLEEGKEKDDITSIQNLNPDKIDHIIDKIDEAEQQNLLGNQEEDCRKECACADEIDTRSRNMGRYEIVKDFLRWMKEVL